MERISAAIARAKKIRGFGEKLTTEHPDEKGPAPRAPLSLPLEVNYTTTKTVPVDRAHLNANKIYAFDQNDVRSSRFDMLRTHLLQIMEADGLQTLGITSPTSACGKTVIAINLAMSIARQFNHTVLLVDFDLRRPTVYKYLGLKTRAGIGDLLAGRSEIKDVLVNIGVERMTVLPNYSRVHGSSEKLMSETTKKIVEELKERYSDRIVIFDLPPVLEIDDTIAFLPNLDCSILVAAEGATSISQLADCDNILAKINNIGVVYNKSTGNDQNYAAYSNYIY